MAVRTLVLFFLLFVSIRTAYYSLDTNLQVSEIAEDQVGPSLQNSTIIAVATFIDDRNTSGWTYYRVQTRPDQPDWLQTYAIGYMEGYIGHGHVWDSLNNWKNTLVTRGKEYIYPGNSDVVDFIDNQTDWIHQMIRQNPNSSYWDLVNTTFSQLNGLYEGFLAAISDHNYPDRFLPFNEFYTLGTYLLDYYDVINKTQEEDRCSYLLKMTNDNLLVSHTTWSNYTNLLRAYKVFEFHLSNPLVRTQKMSLSGRWAAVSSIDDFYILDNNRSVAETTIDTNNSNVFGFIHYDSLPYWIRITVANLAYSTPQNWADTFFQHRSGTYTNQYLLVDFNNYNASKDDLTKAKDIIWIVEEFYNLTSAQDVTQTLLIPHGYVASYNVGYDPDIQALGQWNYTYDNAIRHNLFQKYAPQVENLEDMKYVMRLNNISDTGDYCQAIASRCDLSTQATKLRGAIDVKITSDTMVTSQNAWIIAGPTTQGLPPFSWDDWPQYNQCRAGIPTLWNFDWVYIDPTTNFIGQS